MNVVSFFDGKSGGQLALDQLNIKVDNYYSYEIHKPSIQITQKHYPNTKQMGSVIGLGLRELPFADLVLGGTPCQTLSRSGDGSGFDGKSGLFWEYALALRRYRHVNPKVEFLLENVVMKKEWMDIISEELGVEPIQIDSKYFSAQKRQRLYWTNIDFDKNIPDFNITLKDIRDETNNKPIDHKGLLYFEDGEYRVKNATKKGYLTIENYDSINLDFPNSKTRRGRVAKQKINTLNTGCNQGIFIDGNIYKLSVLECERAQTLPDHYTKGVTDNQRRAMIGNGWTNDVIKHILKPLQY